jgi:hypothetical protein
LNIDNSDAAEHNPDLKNSFMAVTAHFGLILVEHVVLHGLVYNSERNFVETYGDNHTMIFVLVPYVTLFFAAVFMITYYTVFNKARMFRSLGPEVSCPGLKNCVLSCQGLTACVLRCQGLCCCKVRECNVVEFLKIGTPSSRRTGAQRSGGWPRCCCKGREDHDEVEHPGESIQLNEVPTSENGIDEQDKMLNGTGTH